MLDPTDINIYRDLAGGVTTANVLHGSANPIGGKNQVIKLRWGKTRAEDLVFDGAMPGIKFALGENPKDMRQFGQARAAPLSGDAHGRRVRDPRRVHAREGVPEGVAGLRARRRPADRTSLPPRRDLQLEPLVEVLEGKRLVHAHCYRADEILMLIRARRRDGLQDRDVPARARGLQGREGDRRARRRRLDLLRLVGLQGRSATTRFRTTPRS